MVSMGIAEAHEDYEEQLAVLERMNVGDERFARIRAHSDTLISNVTAIEEEMSAAFEHAERREAPCDGNWKNCVPASTESWFQPSTTSSFSP